MQKGIFMRVLLVYPRYPDTFWSFRYALKFVSRKASFPPLGLLTVAGMLPRSWELRLVDMNVRKLRNRDLAWADLVFLSAMSIQSASARQVIDRCKALGVKTVAGGPLFTTHPDDYPDVDHLVLNEAELTLQPFLDDLAAGRAARVYTSDQWADLRTTPPPRWDLIQPRHYASMNVQYSRGCPYDCEFCDITVLYGRRPRTKDAQQVLEELQGLYDQGWRGGVFFVDDNFIGNKGKLKKEILPALIEWTGRRKHPFAFLTEASINLADDPELMRLMVRAGFDTVFVGIESPHEDSLNECRKIPNRNRDLIASVKTIQRYGFQVQGGFIVGFDQDPATIFDRLITFIQESGIVTAMVGLLNAPKGTRLYQRLMNEGRLLGTATGNNMDGSINFVPRMKLETLVQGYHTVLKTIYSPQNYYARVKRFLKDYKPTQPRGWRVTYTDLRAFVRSTLVLGVIGKERIHYWKLMLWSLFTRPRMLPLAVTLSIYGFHFRKCLKDYLSAAAVAFEPQLQGEG